MLRRSLLFLRGVGPRTEARLWAAGVRDWRELAAAAAAAVPAKRRAAWAAGIAQAEAALASGDGAWFASRMPSREWWRLWPAMEPHAVCLDIETTGLSPAWSEVTLVGLARGGAYRAYVAGRDLGEVPSAIEDAGLLVTFNGLQFDLPFLEHAFGRRLAPRAAHIDLRYLLARHGYRGGLKAIERALGWSRPDPLAGLSGFDAIRLWRRWEAGDPGALETLVAYNREDVLNLRRLLELGVSLERERLGPAGSPPQAAPFP